MLKSHDTVLLMMDKIYRPYFPVCWVISVAEYLSAVGLFRLVTAIRIRIRNYLHFTDHSHWKGVQYVIVPILHKTNVLSLVWAAIYSRLV